jgi:hypothetical protein
VQIANELLKELLDFDKTEAVPANLRGDKYPAG